MLQRTGCRLALLALLGGSAMAGCTGAESKVVPTSMTGTYRRQSTFPEGTLELTVTATGIASTGHWGTASVHFNGPKVSMNGSTSDLFRRVACSGDTCSFWTKEGCEGSITKTAAGDLDIVANGGCSGWAGHWSAR